MTALKNILRALVVSLTCVVFAMTLTSPAQAAASGYVNSGARVCDRPNWLTSYCGARAAYGQWAPMYCWTDTWGQGRWFKMTVRTQVGSYTGYVEARNVPRQAVVGHC